MDVKKIHHIAIIPDGNRRWAKEKGLPSFEGHRQGFETTVKLSRKIRQMGIHTTTIWAFSTENWKRTTEEVGYLMGLFERAVDSYLQEALDDQVRIVHLGRKDRIPKGLLKRIINAEEKTKNYTHFLLNVCLDYGGHDEILRAVKKIQEQNTYSNITLENFNDYLDTANQPHPNPDLTIRTSGEMRTSGFMPWQAAYSEYIFLDKYFPDMNEDDIDNSIEEFNNRQRRFGK